MRKLKAKSTEHAVLLDRIPAVAVVQAAWFIPFCRGSTANFSLRMVRPQVAQQFAERDDENVRQCLRRAIGTADEANRTKWDTTLPFSLGSLGLGSAVRTKEAAHWASWACSDMIHNRHATVAASIMTGLTDSAEQSFEALRICKRILGETQLTIPTWEALVEGERSLVEDEGHSSQPRHGWPQKQRNAQRNRSSTTPSGRTDWTERAAGPNVARWRCVQRFLPCVCRIDAQPFRLLLCRRLASAVCVSSAFHAEVEVLGIWGALADVVVSSVLGHHRAACGG